MSIIVDAPREQVFDYLQDIANHPEFTDHYLVDWHLTRIDSVGLGAGARFRVKAPAQPLQLGRRHVRRGASARTGSSRSGAPARTTAFARSASTSWRPAPRGTTRVRFTLETEPATLSDRLHGGARRAGLAEAQERAGDAPAALDHRATGEAAGAARRVTVAGG